MGATLDRNGPDIFADGQITSVIIDGYVVGSFFRVAMPSGQVGDTFRREPNVFDTVLNSGTTIGVAEFHSVCAFISPAPVFARVSVVTCCLQIYIDHHVHASIQSTTLQM